MATLMSKPPLFTKDDVAVQLQGWAESVYTGVTPRNCPVKTWNPFGEHAEFDFVTLDLRAGQTGNVSVHHDLRSSGGIRLKPGWWVQVRCTALLNKPLRESVTQKWTETEVCFEVDVDEGGILIVALFRGPAGGF